MKKSEYRKKDGKKILKRSDVKMVKMEKDGMNTRSIMKREAAEEIERLRNESHGI